MQMLGDKTCVYSRITYLDEKGRKETNPKTASAPFRCLKKPNGNPSLNTSTKLLLICILLLSLHLASPPRLRTLRLGLRCHLSPCYNDLIFILLNVFVFNNPVSINLMDALLLQAAQWALGRTSGGPVEDSAHGGVDVDGMVVFHQVETEKSMR